MWAKRDPQWEKKYEDSIIKVFADYGKGVNKYQDVRGRTFGAGYELFIIAFFIGLYFDRTKPLTEDSLKRKKFGWNIVNSGHIESRNGRNPYGDIKKYMFAALIARTDIDFVALDKGELAPARAVDKLIDKMEQYANFGFDYIHERMEDDPNCFFKDEAFLKIFTSFLSKDEEKMDYDSSDSPESLD